jgi:hypothetical protein
VFRLEIDLRRAREWREEKKNTTGRTSTHSDRKTVGALAGSQIHSNIVVNSFLPLIEVAFSTDALEVIEGAEIARDDVILRAVEGLLVRLKLRVRRDVRSKLFLLWDNGYLLLSDLGVVDVDIDSRSCAASLEMKIRSDVERLGTTTFSLK